MSFRTLQLPIIGSISIPILLLSSVSYAQPRYALEYSVEGSIDECPDEEAFRDLVMERLGYNPFSTQSQSVIRSHISASDAVFAGSLEFRDHDRVTGSRSFSSSSCSVLADTMATTIGVALDVSGRGSDSPPPQPPRQRPSQAEDPEIPPGVTSTSSTPAETTHLPIQFHLGLGLGTSIALMPEPSLNATLAFSVHFSRFVLFVEGRFDGMVSTFEHSLGDVRSFAYTATLAPCVSIRFFLGCISASFGAFEAEGLNVRHPRQIRSFYSTIGPRVGVFWNIRVISVGAYIEGLFPLTRQYLDIGDTTVWRTPLIGMTAFLVASVRLYSNRSTH